MNLRNLLLVFILICSGKALAQFEYGINTSIGRNNFTYVSWMYEELWDGELRELYYWVKDQQPDVGTAIGGFIRSDLFALPLGIEVDIELQYLRSKLYDKGDKTTTKNHFKRVYIPVLLYLKANEKFRLYGGVNYSYVFDFSHLKIPDAKTYTTNYGFQAGFDYQLVDRLKIGMYYYDSFNYDFIVPAFDLGFTASGLAFKMSYSLSGLKKNK
ncbi:MAG: outer membrane beta-barrel protein [Bacteroidales bacterium]|nr:outer membrane beta-barrel protein [Bacteroidales bacterium]